MKFKTLNKCYVRVVNGSGEDQMIVRGSGEAHMRVKSQKYSELDIGGRETCHPWPGHRTLVYHQ